MILFKKQRKIWNLHKHDQILNMKQERQQCSTSLKEENVTPDRKQHDSDSKYNELNDLVIKRFKKTRDKNIPLSAPIVLERGLNFLINYNMQMLMPEMGGLTVTISTSIR